MQKDLTLRFLEVELQLFHSDLTAIITGPQAEGFGNIQNTPSAFLILDFARARAAVSRVRSRLSQWRHG